MPLRPLLALLLVATLAALPAAAQTEEPGCGDHQSRPCEWVVAVDTEGIVEGGDMSVTAGEWIRLTVDNLDDVAHTVTVEGLSVQVSVASLDSGAATFQATRQGDFVLRDQPSGDTGALHVLAAGTDVTTGGTGATSAGGTHSSSTTRGGPGLGPVLLAAALGAAVLLARRR